MAKPISWFCCDSRMPSDPRLVMLPDSDHRWVWLCLLGLEKVGDLEGQDVMGFFHYCQIEHSKFSVILNLMRDKKMLDQSFRPVGFAEWQDAALKAERNKRAYRTAKEKNNSVGSQSVVSRNSAVVSTSETETETETNTYKNKNKNKNSSCPKSGDLTPVANPEPKMFSDEVKSLGQLLAQRILDNDPKAKIPTTEKQKANWLDSIEKLHRLDGRTWSEIEQVINWCQSDGFWKGNILSGLKLRKQFPQLLAKMRSNGGRKLAGEDLISHNRRVVQELNNELRANDGKI